MNGSLAAELKELRAESLSFSSSHINSLESIGYVILTAPTAVPYVFLSRTENTVCVYISKQPTYSGWDKTLESFV